MYGEDSIIHPYDYLDKDKSKHKGGENTKVITLKNIFRAVKRCVKIYYSVLGFGVDLIITLNNGIEYRVSISNDNNEKMIINGETIAFNNVVISFDEISKIKILLSELLDTEFIQAVSEKINNIANGAIDSYNFNDEDYLAVTSDDNTRRISYQEKPRYKTNSQPRYKNLSHSDMIRKEYNNPNNDNRYVYEEEEDYSEDKYEKNRIVLLIENKKKYHRTESMERELQDDKDVIESVSFNGSLDNSKTINSIDSIEYTEVVASNTIISTTVPVVGELDISIETISTINASELSNINVVEATSIESKNIVSEVSNDSTTVLKSITNKPIKVVTDINFQGDMKVVNNVTPTTILVSGPVSTQSKSIVVDVNPISTNAVESILTTTVSSVDRINTGKVTVVEAISTETVSVLEDIGTTEVTVLNSIVDEPISVLKDISTTTVGAIETISMTTISTIKGISEVNSINTQSTVIPKVEVEGALPAKLQVVLPKGIMAGVFPVDTLVLDVLVNGQPITISGYEKIEAITTPASLLDVKGHPSVGEAINTIKTTITPVIDSITKTEGTVVESVKSKSVSVVSSISKENEDVLKGITSTVTSVINSVTNTTVPVINTVIPTVKNINGINTITKDTVNTVLAAMPVEAISSVSIESSQVKKIDYSKPVLTDIVSSISNILDTEVINNITTVTESIDLLSTINSVTIVNMENAKLVGVVDSVSISKKTVSAVESVTLSEVSVPVAKEIEITSVNVSTPDIKDIEGRISTVGSGIMVVEECNSDISIYLVDEINSFTNK